MRFNSTIFIIFINLLLSSISFAQSFPRGTDNVFIADQPGIRTELLNNIAPIIRKSIDNHYYPGAVILVSHKGHIIYRGVFGNKRILPTIAPMQFDTIFDIASLTKVVATTPAIMQLIEQGKLDLDAPVARYFSAFAKNGKEHITIRELLTHTSGLQAGVDVTNTPTRYEWIGDSDEIKQIINLKPHNTPGTSFLYSDLNFIVLAHLVEKITGEHFNVYAQKHIFNPLNMQNSFFLPNPALRDNIAPSEIIDKKLRWGEVQDPIAYAMGGISGHAGLFSNAHDLGAYAECLLNNGLIKNKNYLLSPLTIAKMTTQQTPKDFNAPRALGWDIDSPYTNRGIFFPTHSFGHTGWTGTSIWIDPSTQTWVVILTSRTHPTPNKNNQLVEDRRIIANIVATSLTDISTKNLNNTYASELNRAYKRSNLL